MTEHGVAEGSGVGGRVRGLRRAAGLSQHDLAARAGVSRQAIGALESGRHLPRVDAALRVARALSTTVEDLLAVGPPPASHVLGGELVDGQPVRATRVSDRIVAVPLSETAEGGLFAAPDAVVASGRVEPLDGADLGGFVVVGCDPAMGILAALGPARGEGRLLPVLASSRAARHALTTGRAHAAVVHDRVLPPASADPDRVHRLPLAIWRTGLAAPAAAGWVIGDALAGGDGVIQREAGAASQVAYQRAVGQVGVPDGALATSHLDAARRAVAHGRAAVTIEPAAAALGLDFRALEVHTVEVWIDAAAVDHPGARALGELLASARLRARLSVLPAYDFAGT